LKTKRCQLLNNLLALFVSLRLRLASRKLTALVGLLFVLVGGVSQVALAQQVRGIVRDKETKEPLPFVGIGVKGTTMGTASNENGEFTLNLPSLPQTLVFSELAHVKDTVRVTTPGQSIEVMMAPASVVLSEVKVGSYAYQLVDRAYQQLKKNYDRKFYGKAYYRQITRIDNDPTELLEMVWNAKSNNSRIEGTTMAQGRYAAKQALISDKNFSLYTKAFGLYDNKADTATSLGLFSPNVVDNYLLEIKGVLFQSDTTAVSPLEYIRTNMTYDLVRPGLPAAKMSVAAFTFFYDTSRKPINLPYSKVSSNERDLEAIKKTKYDPAFWANNPVVKRTPLEDEVARSFEQKGAFGTMVKKPEPKADVRIRNGRIE
jgi:hypothetical protein